MNKIKLLRQKAGLSQTALGKKLGIAPNTLSQYENGLRSVPDKIKNMLADYFKVSIDYLLDRDTTNPVKKLASNESDVKNNLINEDMLNKLGFDSAKINNLNSRDIALIATYIKGLLDSKQD